MLQLLIAPDGREQANHARFRRIGHFETKAAVDRVDAPDHHEDRALGSSSDLPISVLAARNLAAFRWRNFSRSACRSGLASNATFPSRDASLCRSTRKWRRGRARCLRAKGSCVRPTQLPASLEHVIAADDDSLALADQVAARVNPKAPVVHRDRIGTIEEGAGGAIVIVAAAIESSRTLLDISRDLRSIAPKSPLFYLVGFSKTTGEPKRERLDRSLIQTHNYFPYQFVAVEKMVLPLSSDANAWADERQLLIDPDITVLVPPEIRDTVEAND